MGSQEGRTRLNGWEQTELYQRTVSGWSQRSKPTAKCKPLLRSWLCSERRAGVKPKEVFGLGIVSQLRKRLWIWGFRVGKIVLSKEGHSRGHPPRQFPFSLGKDYGVSVCVQLLSCVWLFVTLWTVACQASLSVGFSRHEHWTGLPFPSSEDVLNSGIEPKSPTLQGDSLPSESRKLNQ